MKRLLHLLRPAADPGNGVIHPRQQEIERAALRLLAKSGIAGHTRLWPNPCCSNGKPALYIAVDQSSRRISQVALGLLGGYCIGYVQLHFDLKLEGVFWSIHSEAPSACEPTTLGFLAEEMHCLLESEEMTQGRLAQMSDGIQHTIQDQLDAGVLAQKTRAAIKKRRDERGLRG